MAISKKMLKSIIQLSALLFLLSTISCGIDKEINEPEIEEIIEDSIGSGFLEIGSTPGNADVFLDGEYKGLTPMYLYNIPEGNHEILIKKEGYKDYLSEISVFSGKKTFLEADLALIEYVYQEIEPEGEIEDANDNFTYEAPKNFQNTGTVNVRKGFLKYYDFDLIKITDKRNPDSDIFSKRFEKHFVFTRLGNVNIDIIESDIKNVESSDCGEIKGQFNLLYSGQSLCIRTNKGLTAVLGGEWENTENAELIWKVFLD